MEKINFNSIKPVQYGNATSNTNTTSPVSQNKPKDDDNKKIKFALAGLAVIGAAAVAIGTITSGKTRLSKAQGFFEQLTKTTTGNNKIISETLGKNQQEVQNMLDENPKIYAELKEYIKSVIKPKNLNEFAQDGLLYHGTSMDGAVSILESGITPYATKELANSCPGLGRGVYTTPSIDLAMLYSNSGIILPYKFNGEIAELDVPDNKFRAAVIYKLSEIIEPDAKSSILGKEFSKKTMDKAHELTPDAINKAMQDLGYSGLYTPVGTTKGFLSGVFGKLPDNIDTAGQIAIYDGSKLELDTSKLKEINPITKDNKNSFLRFLEK